MCSNCDYTIHGRHHHFGWDNSRSPRPSGWRPARRSSSSASTPAAASSRRTARSPTSPTLDFGKVNPVTGPIFVEGAEPGDALKVTIEAFKPSGFGWTANIPGFGLLADQFKEPALQHLEIRRQRRMEPALFGKHARVPLKPFAGTIGIAPAETGPALGGAAAAGRRQSRHPRPRRRHRALSAGRGGGRAVLGRRHACRAGRRRGLRHGDREPDGRRAEARPGQGRAG